MTASSLTKLNKDEYLYLKLRSKLYKRYNYIKLLMVFFYNFIFLFIFFVIYHYLLLK